MQHRKIKQVQNQRSRRVFPLPPSASRRQVLGAPLLWLLLGAPAFAEGMAVDPFTHGGAASLGLAGTTRGSADNLDNVWHGAAVLALEPRYDIVADGFLDPGTWKGFKVAALDSRTGALAMGIVYSFAQTADLPMSEDELPGWRLPNASTENLAAAQHVAAGLALAPGDERRFSVGLHGGWFWRRATVAGEGSGLRLGASMAGRPTDTLTLSLAGTLPLLVEGARADEDTPWGEAGARWQISQQVALMADAALPLREVDGLDFGVATEATIADLVPVRLGYSRCAGDVRHSLGAGLGVASEALNLHYGIWIDLGPAGAQQALVLPRHALTVSMKL